MYAVIKTGGKQYKVAENDVITVEKLTGEVGEQVSLADVLMLDDGGALTVGTPRVDGASVMAEVVEQGRGEKVIVFKKRRRHNYRRKNGHRQDITVLRVTDILPAGAKPKKAKAKPAATAQDAPVAETPATVEAAPETQAPTAEAAEAPTKAAPKKAPAKKAAKPKDAGDDAGKED